MGGDVMFSLSAQIFTFGMAAKGAGITEKQLRNWLARSLIDIPADDDRTEGNWRRFAVTDVLHVATVARLSRYGVQIEKADQIYRRSVGGSLQVFKRFKNAPEDALVAFLKPIEILFTQQTGENELRWRQTQAGQTPDFAADDAPTDYTIVSMRALLKEVMGRLLVIAEQEAKGRA